MKVAAGCKYGRKERMIYARLSTEEVKKGCVCGNKKVKEGCQGGLVEGEDKINQTDGRKCHVKEEASCRGKVEERCQ